MTDREQELIDSLRSVRELVDNIRCEAMNYHGYAATSNHVMHDIIKCAQIKSAEAMTIMDRLLTDADYAQEPEPLDNDF